MSTTYIYAYSRTTATANAFLKQSGQALTVRDVITDILLLWGVAIPSTAPAYMITRAIHDLNGALQMVWSMSKEVDYFSRETLTLNFNAGQVSQPLPENVLAVLGPCRYQPNGQPLRPIPSRAQFDSYGPIFLGQLGFAPMQGNPQAYWVEMLNEAAPDNVTNILHLVPIPAMAISLLLDVTTQPPRYIYNDYLNSTPIDFPHKYTDSVLLPFVRYRSMSTYFVPNPDVRPVLVADYQNALKIIGAIDPNMKEVEFAERATERAA
jgi:hypothetical protein